VLGKCRNLLSLLGLLGLLSLLSQTSTADQAKQLRRRRLSSRFLASGLFLHLLHPLGNWTSVHH
jgi:hypothetical protein